MKYISIIKDYARKGDSMPPLVALRHITHLYMEQCGISTSLRTVIYESGEYWLARLVDSSEEWRRKLAGHDDYLFRAMRFFHEDYTREEYEDYDIAWLSEDDRKDTIDYMVEQLCKHIDLASNTVRPWNEEWLQAYCWGAYECIKQFYGEQSE